MDLTLSSTHNSASGRDKTEVAKSKEKCMHNLTETFRRLRTWLYSHAMCTPVNICTIILELPKKDRNQAFDHVKA